MVLVASAVFCWILGSEDLRLLNACSCLLSRIEVYWNLEYAWFGIQKPFEVFWDFNMIWGLLGPFWVFSRLQTCFISDSLVKRWQTYMGTNKDHWALASTHAIEHSAHIPSQIGSWGLNLKRGGQEPMGCSILVATRRSDVWPNPARNVS